MSKRLMPQPDLDAPLARYLRQRRKELGKTQRQVAAIIGVSSPAYLYWEKGMRTPTLHNVYFLAKAMEVQPSTLLALLPELQDDN